MRKTALRAHSRLRNRWRNFRALSNGTLVLTRPAWALSDSPVTNGVAKTLIDLEARVVLDQAVFLDCARLELGDERLQQIESLLSAAKEDLIAGCELARSGYLKQAYTLWRSWFEQALFGLYFLEAPINRIAWRVSDSISFGDKPAHRLMLHQLLVGSGDKHPFAMVYESRFDKVMLALRLSTMPKAKKILARTDGIFTTLSQGVHGTFRPKPPSSKHDLEDSLRKFGVPALKEARQVFATYWLCFLADLLGLDESVLSDLGEGKLDSEESRFSLIDGIDVIARLNEPFSNVISGMRDG